ncbi:MAG: aconitate hydratase, partial [Simkania sp.]|nr:aconitate hydratase [Simkania sp.]
EISKFTLAQVDENYYDRAMKHQKTGSFLVGGHNYGQGSSREHAAIAPRYLGVKAVIAKSYARIHRQNLINFGILALTFSDEKDYDSIDQEDILEIKNVEENLAKGTEIEVINKTKGKTFKATHNFTPRELTSIKAGSLINVALEKHS